MNAQLGTLRESGDLYNDFEISGTVTRENALQCCYLGAIASGMDRGNVSVATVSSQIPAVGGARPSDSADRPTDPHRFRLPTGCWYPRPSALRYPFPLGIAHAYELSQAQTTQRQEHEETGVANIKSQMKRIRTNEVARQRNQSVKSALRTAVRSFREAAAAGDKDVAAERLQSVSRKLDKAASKGVIHANQAANKKSALALALNKI